MFKLDAENVVTLQARRTETGPGDGAADLIPTTEEAEIKTKTTNQRGKSQSDKPEWTSGLNGFSISASV